MSPEPQSVMIQPTRAQLWLLCFGLLLGFGGGVALLFQQNLAFVLIGACVALLCGLIVLDLVWRMIIPRPALIITARGVYDDSSLFAARMIYWHEIAEIVVGKQLGFVLTDPQAFLARQPFARRFMLRCLMRVLNECHIAIPPGLLSLPTDQIVQIMIAYNSSYEQATLA